MQSEYCRALDVMSKGGKIVLALPGLDLTWGIYRLSKSSSQKKLGQMMLAGILFAGGLPFMWLVDIICIAKTGHIAWFRDKYEDGVPLMYFRQQSDGLSSYAKANVKEEDVETII